MKKVISILALTLIVNLGYSQATPTGKNTVTNLNYLSTPTFSFTGGTNRIGRNVVYANDTLVGSAIASVANCLVVRDGKDSSLSQLSVHGVLKFGGLSTTGTKTVTIGATAPSAIRTVATAYEWIQVKLWNDSLVYIPCWK